MYIEPGSLTIEIVLQEGKDRRVCTKHEAPCDSSYGRRASPCPSGRHSLDKHGLL